MSLILMIQGTSGTLQATLEKGQYSRSPVDSSQVGHTVVGAAKISGTRHLEPQLYEIEAHVDRATMLAIQAIYQRSKNLFGLSLDPSITVHDTVRELVGDSITRPQVPDTNTTAVPGGSLAYFASFKAFMSAPKISPLGPVKWQVNFTMLETDLP